MRREDKRFWAHLHEVNMKRVKHCRSKLKVMNNNTGTFGASFALLTK